MTPRITAVSFVRAQLLDVQQGLLGFASIHLDDALAVHSVAIRRARDGRHIVSFPAPVDRKGRRRIFVHPLDAAVHTAIEVQVIEMLRRQGILEP